MAVTLSACSSSPPAASASDAASGASSTPNGYSTSVDTSKWPKSVAGSGLAKGLTLPLQQYMQTYQDSVVIENAARSLETSCMARFGFTVVFPPAGTDPPPNADDSNMPRRYGISDPVEAAKYGYELPPDNATHPAPPQLTPAGIAVLTGRKALNPRAAKAPSTYKGMKVPQGGCERQSFDKLGARLDFTLPSKLDHDSLVRSQADPRVQKVINAWSSCMKTKGYTVADPYAAFNAFTPAGSGAPSRQELGLATSDISCKEKTNLIGIWHQADTAIQRQEVEQNQLQLQRLKDENARAVKAAEAALRG